MPFRNDEFTAERILPNKILKNGSQLLINQKTDNCQKLSGFLVKILHQEKS